MREEKIKEYIDRLNTGEYTETIFLRQLSQSVYLARVWDKEPEFCDKISINNPSYQFFFIKNNNGKYVGAVYDAYGDLHWYILEDERKKGHLTKALKEIIIPYLLYDENSHRESQKISILGVWGDKDYENSRKVAENVGFKATNEYETKFVLNKEDFNLDHDFFEEVNGAIDEERFEELKKRLILSFRQLIKISDELLMTYADDKDLRRVAMEVRRLKVELDDLEADNQTDNL